MTLGRISKTAMYFLGALISASTLTYFLYYAIQNWSNFPNIEFNYTAVVWFVAMMGLYLLSIVANGIVWTSILNGIGSPFHWCRATTIVAIAQFAKYLPGNVGHLVGRVALAKSDGLRVAPVMVSLVIESAWVVLIAAALGLVAIATTVGGVAYDALPPLWALVLVIAACLVLPTAGLLLLRAPMLRGLTSKYGLDTTRIPPVRNSVTAAIFTVSTFLLNGLILQILSHEIFGLPDASWFRLTAVYALAWVAGYLTPGSPAGLGIRELVLLALLAPEFGTTGVVALSAGMRLITSAGDVFGLLSGLGMRRVTKA